MIPAEVKAINNKQARAVALNYMFWKKFPHTPLKDKKCGQESGDSPLLELTLDSAGTSAEKFRSSDS